MSASSATTTASGSASLSLTKDNVDDTLSSGTKDVSQIGYVTNVTGSGHTHSVTIPSSVVNYIIKT